MPKRHLVVWKFMRKEKFRFLSKHVLNEFMVTDASLKF